MARHREFDTDIALQKAMEVFWLKGYEATSVQDLLNAMGIHRGSLYDTFGDKHALYLAALKRYQQSSYKRLTALFARVESANEALSIFFLDLIKDAETNPARGCFMNNAMVEVAAQDIDVAEITSCNTELMVKEIVALLKRGQEQNEIRQDKEAEVLAQYLVSAVQGLKVMAKNGSDQTMLRNIIDVTLSAIQAK